MDFFDDFELHYNPFGTTWWKGTFKGQRYGNFWPNPAPESHMRQHAERTWKQLNEQQP